MRVQFSTLLLYQECCDNDRDESIKSSSHWDLNIKYFINMNFKGVAEAIANLCRSWKKKNGYVFISNHLYTLSATIENRIETVQIEKYIYAAGMV